MTSNSVVRSGAGPYTLLDIFLAATSGNRADLFRFKHKGGWQPISEKDARDSVLAFAVALQGLGVRQGDRVGLLSENRPEWLLSDFAVQACGAADVPIYPNLPADQVAHILRDCEAKIVIVSTREQMKKVRSVQHHIPNLKHIIVLDTVGIPINESVHSYRELLRSGSKVAIQEEITLESLVKDLKPEDTATLIYTSGTTGLPKGVVLTHGNIASNVRNISSIIEVGPDDQSLCLLPLAHAFERTVSYTLLNLGAKVAFAESIEKAAENLLEIRPTIMASAPRMYEKVFAKVTGKQGVAGKIARWAVRIAVEVSSKRTSGHCVPPLLGIQHRLADGVVYKKVRAGVGGRIRFFVSGGAPLSKEIAQFFHGAGILILEGYGLTETSPVLAVNTPEALRFGTVGRPLPETEICIAEDGEILARGPQIMKGYFNNPEATEDAIDGEGWFHTGDIGEIDADGFLRITDRKKDLLKTANGKYIAPAPIENRVKLHKLVSEAVMLGDAKPYGILLVVPEFATLSDWAKEQGIRVSSQEDLASDPRVRDYLEKEVLPLCSALPRHEQPKKIGVLPRDLSLESGEITPTLKVKRKVVVEKYKDLIETLYAEERSE